MLKTLAAYCRKTHTQSFFSPSELIINLSVTVNVITVDESEPYKKSRETRLDKFLDVNHI